jgi:hypothetical protein
MSERKRDGQMRERRETEKGKDVVMDLLVLSLSR